MCVSVCASILGVTHDCTDADIKKYYKRQALLVHPDKSRSPGAEEAFKILRRAFELIGFPVSLVRVPLWGTVNCSECRCCGTP